MGVFVYPPVVLVSSPPVPGPVLNPDGTEAQFNFTTIEPGQVVDLTTIISGTPITLIASLSAVLRRVEVNNQGGKNLLLTVGARPPMVITKGDAGDGEFSLYGDVGEAVTLTTEDGSTGSGELKINFLG